MRSAGLWHYEFVEARGLGHQWRVGDADDTVVTDFGTESEARQMVEHHNASVRDKISQHVDKIERRT